jgi:outer membrane protein OmpA-like peptidoglycan-associated protein
MRLLVILTCFIFSYTHAQNLIPNSSFEDENICELAIPCSPACWYSVSYMPFGYENKFEHHTNGMRAISFLAALKEGARTYWQVPLLYDLKKNETYSLHFYLYTSVKKFKPEYFGIYFSNTFYRSAKDSILQLQGIKISDRSIRKLKNDWLEISLNFKAEENAKYLLIGNFSATSNEDILKDYSKKTEFIEYYIDDISLTATQLIIPGDQATMAKRSDSLYLSNYRHKLMKDPNTPITNTVKRTELPSLKTDTLLLGKINFRFDSYDLLNQQMIRNYFNTINSNSITRIAITGYTDSVGNNTYNQRLSENRAISVKKFLADSLQIPPAKISTVGKGKTNDQKLQEDNRRVELIIYRKE